MISGEVLVAGTSICVDVHEVLFSTVPLSFWGGIDPITGKIVDHTHPLHGCEVRDKFLVIPSGRGSCTGSQVLLELILNGIAPKAIILRDKDAIICTGAIVAEEVFSNEIGHNLPWIFCIGEEGFQSMKGARFASIKYGRESNSLVSIFAGPKEVVVKEEFSAFSASDPSWSEPFPPSKSISGHGFRGLHLSCEEEDLLVSGTDAQKIAMRTICRIGVITGSPRLVPVSQAHIDGCTYIGPGGLSFVRKLVELGGEVAIPTTLNSVSVDRRRWEELGIPITTAQPANAVGDAYLKLGCTHSFTCAPYLLPSKPGFGENIVWGESNAVVFANSILGARTDKYADYFDICAALIGRVPEFGVHLDENRMPRKIIDVTDVVIHNIIPTVENRKTENIFFDLDSFFPTLGYLCGNLSDGKIPLIKGLEPLLGVVSHDDLKAFCAAFGTTGTAPLVHISGITPEAIDPVLVRQMEENCIGSIHKIGIDDLELAYDSLDSGSRGINDKIELIAFGNPHLSLTECERLSKLVTGTAEVRALIKEGNVSTEGASDVASQTATLQKHPDVEVSATLSRHVLEQARERGFLRPLEEFGMRFINDTCWCMLIQPPVIPMKENGVIMTNSGKYAHYGPGLTNRTLRFGSMVDCISAAVNGVWGVKSSQLTNRRKMPSWLKTPGIRGNQVRRFSPATFARFLW